MHVHIMTSLIIINRYSEFWAVAWKTLKNSEIFQKVFQSERESAFNIYPIMIMNKVLILVSALYVGKEQMQVLWLQRHGDECAETRGQASGARLRVQYLREEIQEEKVARGSPRRPLRREAFPVRFPSYEKKFTC